MALALVLAAAATPILSCPGGTIETKCTAAEVSAKIALTRARVANIAQRCLYDFGGKCSVEASGRINAADRGAPLLWQKMLLAPRGGPQTRMLVLLSQDKAGKTTLAGFAESSGAIGTPDLVVDGDNRRLVHVGGTLAGSGGGNADALFVSDAVTPKWRRVDLSDWSEQGSRMLPTGYWLRGPARFVFDEMFASVPVARDGDGNCCPRGGNAFYDLDIQGDRLVLTRLRFQPMQPMGRDIEVTAGTLED
ncbi:MAG: hypothetical protein LCH74_16280 [Proteobacteria bacterium]|nr:hypothetical protein [Pseudomonadota bacterium]